MEINTHNSFCTVCESLVLKMKVKSRIIFLLILSSTVTLLLVFLMPSQGSVNKKRQQHVQSNNKFIKFRNDVLKANIFGETSQTNDVVTEFGLLARASTRNLSTAAGKKKLEKDTGDTMKARFDENQAMPVTKRNPGNIVNELIKNVNLDANHHGALHNNVVKIAEVTDLPVNDTLKSSLMENVIKNCITGKIFAKYTRDLAYSQLITAGTARAVESVDDRRNSFKQVFNARAWGHDWDTSHKGLNASGMGSTLYWSQEMIGTLHVVLNSIKRHLRKETLHILDSACGDFVWMSRFLKTRQDVFYTGVDVVPDLIEHHKKAYGGFTQWRFWEADVLDPSFQIQEFDLIINRMMLQHLYSGDVLKLLEKFSNSGSHFVLLTTFPSHSNNKELDINVENPGRFRFLNLELPPVSLTPPMCLQRDGPIDAFQGWDHFIGLWKLPLTQVKFCDKENMHSYRIKNTPAVVHTCTFIQEVH